MASESDWFAYFEHKYIPDEVARRYATIFASNRLFVHEFLSLTRSDLDQLHVAMGDQLRLLASSNQDQKFNHAPRSDVEQSPDSKKFMPCLDEPSCHYSGRLMRCPFCKLLKSGDYFKVSFNLLCTLKN